MPPVLWIVPDDVLWRVPGRISKYNLSPAVPNVPIKHHWNGLCYLHLTTHLGSTHGPYEEEFSICFEENCFFLVDILSVLCVELETHCVHPPEVISTPNGVGHTPPSATPIPGPTPTSCTLRPKPAVLRNIAPIKTKCGSLVAPIGPFQWHS